MKVLRGNRGAAVVEFAVLFLLLMIIVFGILEFGFLWLQSHYIANTAREGARVAARVEDPKNNTDDRQKVENAVKEYLNDLPFYEAKIEDCCSTGDFIAVNIENENEDGVVIDAGLGAENPGAVRVTVTVQTAEVWQPILWDLITLIPGANQIEIDEVSEHAVFAVENQ